MWMQDSLKIWIQLNISILVRMKLVVGSWICEQTSYLYSTGAYIAAHSNGQWNVLVKDILNSKNNTGAYLSGTYTPVLIKLMHLYS